MSMPAQQQWSVCPVQKYSNYCQDPMENQAGVMLPMTPAQAAGNWGALLPLWKHPQKHPAEGHHCFVSRRVMFSLTAALIAWRGGHLGMSQQPHPLPFFPPLPPAVLRNAWMQKYPSLGHQCSPVHPSPGPCVLSLPATVPRCLCASLFHVSALAFSPLLSFRNIYSREDLHLNQCSRWSCMLGSS